MNLLNIYCTANKNIKRIQLIVCQWHCTDLIVLPKNVILYNHHKFGFTIIISSVLLGDQKLVLLTLTLQYSSYIYLGKIALLIN